MQIHNHPHKQELIDVLPLLTDFIQSSPDYRLPSFALHFIDNNVNVVFDDVQKPFVPDTMDNLRHLIHALLEKYKDPEIPEAKTFVDNLVRLSDQLSAKEEHTCGEGLYYPWFDDVHREPYRDDAVRRDAQRVRRALLSGSVGYAVAGSYNHDTRTITLFTQNIGDDSIVYISTFAHEFFHAAHHFLLDRFGNGEPLAKYYHTVVLETLATRFQIDFLTWLASQGNADAGAEANHRLQTIMRYSPIFFPYSGAKYAYSSRRGNTQPSVSDATEQSCHSFEDTLRTLIADPYEAGIILRMDKPLPAEPATHYSRNGSLSVHAPTTYSPADVINGTAIYLLPHNETLFRGMMEERFPFGVQIHYEDGETLTFGPIDSRVYTSPYDLYVYLSTKGLLTRGTAAESVFAYVIW